MGSSTGSRVEGDPDLEHLRPEIRPITCLPAEERLRFVRADRWIGYTRAAAALERLEELYGWPGRQRMPNMLLIGPTNNGNGALDVNGTFTVDGGTAAHEFGHAIGLAHEHSNPAGGIQWNEQAVIRAMAGPPNYWNESQTRHNILRKYAANQVNGTDFDPKSVMLYFFPAEWTVNGVATSRNEVLSELDKQFIAGAKMYPRNSPGLEGAKTLVVDAPRTEASIGKPGGCNPVPILKENKIEDDERIVIPQTFLEASKGLFEHWK